jgi:protein involved in polysaccharide export with SLBB domain
MVCHRFPWFVTAPICAYTILCATGVCRGQQNPADKPAPEGPATSAAKTPAQTVLVDENQRKAIIDKMIADYDLMPHSFSIPENPPPHEGALVSLPHVVEPPDLVIVEVLEALEGRPISGERMVRPDGKVSLGFYGDVPVRGLTVPQMKVAIIKQLRKFLSDQILGLEIPVPVEQDVAPLEPPRVPRLPGEGNPFDVDEAPKPVKKTSRATASVFRNNAAYGRAAPPRLEGRRVPARSTAARGHHQDPVPVPAGQKTPAQIRIPAGGARRITITIDPGGALEIPSGQPQPVGIPALEPAIAATDEKWRIVPPDESDCVFVDVTAYNSMNYYVQGDVSIVGRMPFTGNETVLDALQYAGGLISSADPNQISLVRPERHGKRARVYKVDLAAIRDRGEVATNYQVFPGDRLVVGRNQIVQKTIEMDRLNAPIQTMNSMMLQHAFLLRVLQFVSSDRRDELLKEYVDFWTREMSRSGGEKFDEQTVRDAFIRKMKLTPPREPSSKSE